MSDLKSYNRLKCPIEILCVITEGDMVARWSDNTGLSIEMSRFHLSNYFAFLGMRQDYLCMSFMDSCKLSFKLGALNLRG